MSAAAALVLAWSLSGCAVASLAGAAVETTATAAGGVISVTGSAVGAAADAVTPDPGDD
ncbi:MAG: hypothetical protein ACQEUZ_17070 [Pseudomonadota bacterium]